jgi:hypothetical protein
MKKSQIIVSLIMALAVCSSAVSQPENTQNVSKQKGNSFYSYGIEVPILFGNGEFRDFMSDNFDMHSPNALFGGTISFGSYFSPSKRWTWEYAASFRSSNRSKKDITRNWSQVYAALRFSYAILDNKSFRLSPFGSVNVVANQLYYSDKRSVGNLDKITEILETSFTSFTLGQWTTGCELGLQIDFKIDDAHSRSSPRWSAFAKWEQSFYNSNWQLEKHKMRDIPKFQNNALVIGLTIGMEFKNKQQN